jgi:SAM-dependent methyltransferase
VSVNSSARLHAVDMFGAALIQAASMRGSAGSLRVVDRDGEELPLALGRYLGEVAAEESSVLDRTIAPVLDVGCGAGRHVVALSRRGVAAVGLDISPVAVRLARERGARAIEGSIFDSVPGSGTWGSALLLDGNIGIGGVPERLLARLGELLCPSGVILVEVEPYGVRTGTLSVALETDEARSEYFRWARLSIDGLPALAAAAGFSVREHWQLAGRWFAVLASASACRA